MRVNSEHGRSDQYRIGGSKKGKKGKEGKNVFAFLALFAFFASP
jgi:hypothetical protein